MAAAARLVQIGHGAHDSLFGAHQGEADCRLFDQLRHADAAGFVADLPAPVLHGEARPALRLLAHTMAPPGAYLARGPPLRA